MIIGVVGKRIDLATPIDGLMIIVFLMAMVSVAISINQRESFLQVCRLTTGIFLFYGIVYWVKDQNRLLLAFTGIILAGVGLSLLAPFSVQWRISKIPGIPVEIYDRFAILVSDTIHRNVMAGSLLIILPIPLAFILFGWKRLPIWSMLLISTSSVMILGMLLLTQTRGAWLAIGISIAVMVLMRWPRTWYIIPVGVVGTTISVLLIGWDTILGWISRYVDLGGLDQRMDIWARAIYMLEDFPITGVGMGMFGNVADLLYPFFLAEPGEIPHAHNLFLQVGVDLGLPGLIAWLSIFFSIMWISWETFRHGKKTGDRLPMALGAGFFASQVGLLVHGQFDAVWWGMVRPAPLLWGIWGIAMAAWSVTCGKSLRTSPDLQVEDDQNLVSKADI